MRNLKTEIAYALRRSEQEAIAAIYAGHRAASLAHGDMARAYTRRVQTLLRLARNLPWRDQAVTAAPAG